MLLFTQRLTRRLFIKWLGMVVATIPGVGSSAISAHPAPQTPPTQPGYGRGAYGQGVYIGTPPASQKTFMPVINRGGQ